MRMYITPVRLHHMSANIPDVCSKCLTEKGTLFHCQWECLKIQDFWKDVLKCLSDLFNTKVPLNAGLCLLGIYPKNFKRTLKQTKLLDIGLLQDRRAIAIYEYNQRWKSGLYLKENRK